MPDTRKMHLRKFKSGHQWYSDCPVCPIVKGWHVGTWAECLEWVVKHLAEHASRRVYIERPVS